MIDKAELATAIRSNNREKIGGMLLDIAGIVTVRERDLKPPDRADLSQEVVLYLLLKIDKVDTTMNPFGYLLRVAKNRVRKLRTRIKSKNHRRWVWESVERIEILHQVQGSRVHARAVPGAI